MNRLVLGLVAAALLVPVAAAQPPAPRGAPACPGFREDAALGPVCPGADGMRILLRDGSSMLVHDHARHHEETEATMVATDGLATRPGTAPLRAPPCASDLAREARFVAVYAAPFDAPNRYAEHAQRFRDAISRANGFLNQEASLFNATADLRFRCEGDAFVLRNVTLPTPFAQTTVSSAVSDLRAMGYDLALEKYLAFVDAYTGAAGYASLSYDDRLVADNANNNGRTYAVFNATGGLVSAKTVIHETLHLMGGVQKTAPHSTGAGHCTDGYDVMCYADGGPTATQRNACFDREWLDCGHDDYFHVAPPAGSYLATRWNVASTLNRWLVLSGASAPAEPAPTLPDLTLAALAVTPAQPLEGEVVTLTATVRETAGAAAGAFAVRFDVGGAPAGEVALAGLAAGGEATVTLQWTARAGTHVVAALADAAGQVAESDEADNAASGDLSAQAVVRAIGMTPEHQRQSVKTRATFDVVVTNAGNVQDAYRLTLAGLPAGWTATLSATQVELTPGQSATVKLTVTPPKSGASSALVTVAATSTGDATVTQDVTTETIRR